MPRCFLRHDRFAIGPRKYLGLLIDTEVCRRCTKDLAIFLDPALPPGYDSRNSFGCRSTTLIQTALQAHRPTQAGFDLALPDTLQHG